MGHMQNSSCLGVPGMFLSISEQWCSLASAPKSLCPDSDTQYGVGTQGEASWNLLEGGQQLPSPPRTQLWASAAFQKTGCCCLPPPCPAFPEKASHLTGTCIHRPSGSGHRCKPFLGYLDSRGVTAGLWFLLASGGKGGVCRASSGSLRTIGR